MVETIGLPQDCSNNGEAVNWPVFFQKNLLYCYSDDLRGSINFNQPPFAYNCDDVISSIDYLLSEKNFGINVFPNPSNDFIKIESKFNIEEVNIYNALGLVVFNEKLQNQEKETLIDISFLSSGNYFIQIGDSFVKLIKF